MWSAGVAVEVMPGVRITGRYFNTYFGKQSKYVEMNLNGNIGYQRF
jgi:hypothetical protein